ncbi:ornithine carbamoyltransferase [Congregibacter variabilis]|uniref:Ornithine carbamoyltransferase n=1 Tax=Congregibacter variabilis TaxID=3081200 RepID=A0ABZ0I0A1_9GAMM|nr:ornithine carbamoyltransferase [Congregibacter sp. IMCC43200]
MSTQHFLTLQDLSPQELDTLIDRAIELKAAHRAGEPSPQFPGSVMAMIFAKSSTRTRVSFESGMAQMGGHAMFLSPGDTQLGRGEPIEDSARVISSMVDIVMIRTFGHDIVERFAAYSSVPVINALTDEFHPCQLLADMQTYREHRGSIKGKTVCWLGDGNNMCHSYINAARQFDFQLNIACPKGFEPRADLVSANSDRVKVVHDARDAVEGASLLVTDVWASMGQEEEQARRAAAMAPFQLNTSLLNAAATDALYMHCLPAHRGEEISAELMDAPDTIIWDEAENRLHAQKALVERLLLGA